MNIEFNKYSYKGYSFLSLGYMIKQYKNSIKLTYTLINGSFNSNFFYLLFLRFESI